MFDDWCMTTPPTPVAGHEIATITSYDDHVGIQRLAATLPGAYADTDALALIAERHGKPGLATFLRHRLPTKKSARSGDAGEILATIYLDEEHGYVVGPSRLIDRDHQEWAMRGDDVLAAKIDDSTTLRLIKTEAKSRKTLGKATVEQARDGLSRNQEMPSPHSLSQFATRLLHADDHEVGEAVLDLQLTDGIRPDQLGHLMFLLTSSDPSAHVSADLNGYGGKISQLTVTMRVQHHQSFINDPYDEVVASAP